MLTCFSCNAHSRIHTFYLGTIDHDKIGQSDVDGEPVNPSWYATDELQRGYAYSRLGGRINPNHFSNNCGVDPILLTVPTGRESREQNANRKPDVDVDEPPTHIFDGRFSKEIGECFARPGFKDRPVVEQWPKGNGSYVAVLNK